MIKKPKTIFKQNLQDGFTLVELLAVTFIIVIVSGLIVGILYSTLRGGNKTKAINDVTQSGNFALSMISHTILVSDAVAEVSGVQVDTVNYCTTKLTGNQMKLRQIDGSFVEFLCQGSRLTSQVTLKSGTVQPQVDLIDPMNVKIDTCSFSCSQTDSQTGNTSVYYQPIIGVSFSVSQKAASTTNENSASSSFNTSVTMRNYNPY